jgi:glycosyltransferase involved in cell wall biosynthesis
LLNQNFAAKECTLTVKTNYLLTIPCFNESKSLTHLLPEISKLLELESKLCVVIVDNGSVDDTYELVKRYIEESNSKRLNLVRKEFNTGYGAGIKQGFEFADSDVVIWTHADLQCELNDVVKAIKEFENSTYPIVVKGRRQKRSKPDSLISSLLSVSNFLFKRVWISDINAQPNLVPRSWLPPAMPDDSTFELQIFTYLTKKKRELRRFVVKFPNRQYGEGFNQGINRKLRFIRACLKAMKSK